MSSVQTSMLTVATLSYVPQALVALGSAHKVGTARRHFLFALDAPAASILKLREVLDENGYGWVEIFGPDDLGDLRSSFLKTFTYYTAFEVANVAKYIGIRHVLSRKESEEICVFVDSDTYFVADVGRVLEEMQNAAILLTPHQIGPSSDELEQEYLLHGWLNSGFSAYRRLHPQTPAILQWLTDRISRRAYLATHFGLSGDQPWLSGCPIIFSADTCVTFHPGMNVAYWNLTERKISLVNQEFRVNNHPLIFFHFSGFDVSRPLELSKHARTQMVEGSALAEICRLYSLELKRTDQIRPILLQLETLSFTSGNLQTRMYAGTKENNISFASPGIRPGILVRLAMKIEALLSQIIS